MALGWETALGLWHRTMVAALNRDLPDLTQRQFALLLQVYMVPPPHTVRGLAETLKMSKPAVTRAVDRLSAEGLVQRKTDEADRRSVLIGRTARGATYLRDFGDMVAGLTDES